MTTIGDIRPGHVYHVGAACGVPHGFRPIYIRVISVDPRSGWDGMAWLDVYELDHHGTAVERRRIYVITAGLREVYPAKPATAPAARRRPKNTGPARIPRPRTSPDPITPGRTR